MNVVLCDCIDCGGKRELTPAEKYNNGSVSYETPWAVGCFNCGLVYLSNHEYNRQMRRADSIWCCPICKSGAYWNDEIYEKWLDSLPEE